MGNIIELQNTETQEVIVVRISDPMLYDKILSLSVDYSVSTEFLVNVAIKKLVDDVYLVRKLRTGRTEW